MPQAIPQFLAYVATSVSAAIGGAAATATGSIAIGGAVSTAVYYGTQALAYVGLTAATAGAVPRPEAGSITLKNPTPTAREVLGRARIAGSGFALWTAKGNWAGDVLLLCNGPITAFGQVYLFDKKVSQRPDGNVIPPGDGSYPADFVWIFTRKGEFAETAYPELVTGIAGVSPAFPEWTPSHRGDGIASLAMIAGHGNAKDFNGRYPGGEPQASVVVDGRAVYDPRNDDQDPSDPSTWAWSQNLPLLHLWFEAVDQRRAYKDDVDGDGKAILVWDQTGWDRYFAPNIEMWKTAADIADEPVTLKAGGTTPRWWGGGFYEKNNSADSVRQALLAAYDGWTGQDGSGALTIYAGKLYEPTVTIGDDDILDYRVQRFVEDESAINQVIASYTEPGIDYTTAECLPFRDEADIASTGRERTEPLALPWVQNNSQARRLAKLRLKLANARTRGSIRCFLTDNALNALGQRYINLICSDSPALEDGIIVQVMSAEIDLTNLSIAYSWVEVDPDIDAWNAAAEEGDPPFGEERAAAEATPQPSGVTVTAEFAPISTGGQGVRLRIAFNNPGREDLTYLVRSRISTEATYNYEEFTAAYDLGATMELVTGFKPVDVMMDVDLQFVSGASRPGERSATVSVSTSTAVVAPAPPTGFSAADGVGHSLVAWTNPASTNLHHLKVYRGTTTSFGSASAVSGDLTPTGNLVPQTWDDTGRPPGTYYYWIRSFNASGAGSAAVGPDAAIVT